MSFKITQKLSKLWGVEYLYVLEKCYNSMSNNNFEEFQRKIIKNWREEIPDKTILLQDATCYEVYIRFPTDPGRRCG